VVRSGAQQLAIARALITSPRLLDLGDHRGHPPSVVAEIQETILSLTRAGDLEQHVGFALRAAERYYVLESGRVTSSGTGGQDAEHDVRQALAV